MTDKLQQLERIRKECLDLRCQTDNAEIKEKADNIRTCLNYAIFEVIQCPQPDTPEFIEDVIRDQTKEVFDLQADLEPETVRVPQSGVYAKSWTLLTYDE